MRDYYEILGVSRGCDDAALKSAFRKAAMEHHPDRNQGCTKSEAKFKELQGRFGKDASLSQVKPYLKDIKGIKVDGPVITVEFK